MKSKYGVLLWLLASGAIFALLHHFYPTNKYFSFILPVLIGVVIKETIDIYKQKDADKLKKEEEARVRLAIVNAVNEYTNQVICASRQSTQTVEHIIDTQGLSPSGSIPAPLVSRICGVLARQAADLQNAAISILVVIRGQQS